MMAAAPIIEVKDLVKKFPLNGLSLRPQYETIIDSMTFTVHKGDHVAIIGANGSGKTTLMKILAGIYLPDSGTVKILGFNVQNQLGKVLDHVSFVSPALNFLKKLTLRDIILFYSKAQGKDPEPAFSFIEDFQLSFMLEKRLEVFSEGQKALTRYAIGFIKQPDIMLVDEVTANLDMQRKERLLTYLAACKDRITFVITDQDVVTVDRLTNKILLLKRGGSVMKLGDVQEILKTIPYRYVMNVIPKRIMDKPFWDGFDQPWRDSGSHVQFLCQAPEEVHALVGKLIDNPEILSYTTSGLSIEDIYYFYLVSEDFRSSEGLGRISYEDEGLI
jgi:ABC-type multidrug transport system ATPase subunit